MSRSGLRRWTKHDEMKKSTKVPRLNPYMRYLVSSLPSLLTAATLSRYFAFRREKSPIISGLGRDPANMNALKSSKEKARS